MLEYTVFVHRMGRVALKRRHRRQVLKDFLYSTNKFGFYFRSLKKLSKGNFNCQSIVQINLNPSYRSHKNQDGWGDS